MQSATQCDMKKTSLDDRSTLRTLDIVVAGAGRMGANLALNLADHRMTVGIVDAQPAKAAEAAAQSTSVKAAQSLAELVRRLKRPRRVILMVPAGKPVDDVIADMIGLLEPGDIIVDGGNSHFEDTNRRVQQAASKGLLYVGAGISGGEEGARQGACVMAGGAAAAWPRLKRTLEAIAAKGPDGFPCCAWLGAGGAGHFVKCELHNGIEYGDLALMGECYHLMLQGLGMTPFQIGDTFDDWNHGDLGSYLLEVASSVLAFRDADGAPLVSKILDAAEQKGTGKCSAMAALNLGTPCPLIAEAVFARNLSAMKDERLALARHFRRPTPKFKGSRARWLSDLSRAFLASRIICLTQGFMLMQAARAEYRWPLRGATLARIWQGGCIIRSALLDRVGQAFDENAHLESLLLSSLFARSVTASEPSWRRVVGEAIKQGLPVPALASALSFFDQIRHGQLPPASLIQGIRDAFGAHGYKRADTRRGKVFHTVWKAARKLPPENAVNYQLFCENA